MRSSVIYEPQSVKLVSLKRIAADYVLCQSFIIKTASTIIIVVEK